MDSKLSDDEEPEGQKAKAKENDGLENERDEFAAHNLDSKLFEKVFVAFNGRREASDNLCATDTVPVVTVAAIGLRFGEGANENREPAVR